MKKYGFTVAETLIVLGIIGILMMSAIATVKPFDKGIRYLYTNAAVSLDRAYYNAMGISAMESPFDDSLLNNNGTGDNGDGDDDGDGDEQTTGDGQEETPPAEADTGAKRLCLALTRYINPVDKHAACKADPVSPMANEFSDDKIQFVAVNGMRFYVSDLIRGSAFNNNDINFYIVFVDVNGEKGPNSAEYVPEGQTDANGKKIKPKTPDIFAFAVLPISRIIPIGAPEIDTKFMTTRISFLTDNMSRKRFSTEPKAYYKTKADAWDFYGSSNLQQNVSTYDPYTYNDAIRKIINDQYEDNLIYKNAEIPNDYTRDENFLALLECNEEELEEGETCPTKREGTPACIRDVSATNLDDAIDACRLHIDNYAF